MCVMAPRMVLGSVSMASSVWKTYDCKLLMFTVWHLLHGHAGLARDISRRASRNPAKDKVKLNFGDVGRCPTIRMSIHTPPSEQFLKYRILKCHLKRDKHKPWLSNPSNIPAALIRTARLNNLAQVHKERFQNFREAAIPEPLEPKDLLLGTQHQDCKLPKDLFCSLERYSNRWRFSASGGFTNHQPPPLLF